jgi:hypothetical protein
MMVYWTRRGQTCSLLILNLSTIWRSPITFMLHTLCGQGKDTQCPMIKKRNVMQQYLIANFRPKSLLIMNHVCLWHDLGGYSLDPHHRGPDLWCTKWQWDRFFSKYFSAPSWYHSTDAQYSYCVHLPLTVHNLSNQVLLNVA